MDIIIHHVDIINNGRLEEFAVAYECVVDGESTSGTHFFPTEIFETRAAEYNIPMSDFFTLLDIVMYEPYLPSDTFDEFRTIHTAFSIDDAREHHLQRIASVKNSGSVSGVTGESFDKRNVIESQVIETSGSGDPVEFLESTAYLDDDYCELKKEYVESLRTKVQEGAYADLGVKSFAAKKMAARSSVEESARRGRPALEIVRNQLLPDIFPSPPLETIEPSFDVPLADFLPEQDRNLLKSIE